jgi:hypothetical protein
VSADGYEYARPTSIGGAAGTFTLTSPWGNQACEYAIRVISASGAGGLCVTYDTNSSIAVSDTTVTNSTGGVIGELINCHAAGVYTPAALYSSCPFGVLVLTVTGASNILVTVHWRRQLAFARMPDVYHINPDTTPEEAIHAQRERDLAAYAANPAKAEGA